ncbi:hypothetical protein M9H77_24695 [Catharanthus roseus]|uniref:Uncharacterized protein n=1 Tax=Catharanthus roseus TaxID=4058 RepID=A0ACC0A4R8_CATRO|nr:hypothetical protein M9H77_24695 [Catharanthus roseus]
MDSLVLSARVKEAEAANTDASEFQQHEMILAETETLQKREIQLEQENACLRAKIAENDRLQQLSIVPPGQEHEYNAMQAYLARNLLQLNMMEGVPVFSVPDKKSLHLGYVISCIEFVFENFLELRGDIGLKLIYLDIYDNTSQDFLFQVGSTGLIPLPNEHLGTLLQGLSREETWLYMTIMEFDLLKTLKKLDMSYIASESIMEGSNIEFACSTDSPDGQNKFSPPSQNQQILVSFV